MITKSGKCFFSVFSLSALLALFSLHAIGNRTFESRIMTLPAAWESSQVDSIRSILYDLSLKNCTTELKYTRDLLGIKDRLNEISYFHVLRHYANIVPSNNLKLMNLCIWYAKNNGLWSYISSMYVMKSLYFEKRAQYDSAMICTLKARDDAEKNNNIEQQANALMLLGDLYSNAGIWDKATAFYHEADRIKGNEKTWRTWRRRVIRDNLALIEKNKHQYPQALKLLRISRSEIPAAGRKRSDSIALAYVQNEIAASLYGMNEMTSAKAYNDSAFSLLANNIDDTKELFTILLTKSKIAIRLNDLKTASGCVEKAENMLSAVIPEPNERIELLLIKSDLYGYSGNSVKAFSLFRKYQEASDSLHTNQKIVQVVQIKSENDYEILKERVTFLTKQRLILLLLFVTGGLFTAIICLQYVRIMRKNRYLVAMSIRSLEDKKNSAVFLQVPVDPENSTTRSKPEHSETADLIKKLYVLVEKERIYLQMMFHCKMLLLSLAPTGLQKANRRGAVGVYQ